MFDWLRKKEDRDEIGRLYSCVDQLSLVLAEQMVVIKGMREEMEFLAATVVKMAEVQNKLIAHVASGDPIPNERATVH
jgi:uncharacterized coiled-coil protein SlyX